MRVLSADGRGEVLLAHTAIWILGRKDADGSTDEHDDEGGIAAESGSLLGGVRQADGALMKFTKFNPNVKIPLTYATLQMLRLPCTKVEIHADGARTTTILPPLMTNEQVDALEAQMWTPSSEEDSSEQ